MDKYTGSTTSTDANLIRRRVEMTPIADVAIVKRILRN